MTRSESKQAMLYELGAVPVVADALDPDQVAEAVGRARPDVIVHQLTAIGPVDLRHFDRDFALTPLCNLLGVLWRKAQMIRIIAALMILNTSALAEPVPSVQFLEDSATQAPIILDPLPLADIVSYRYVPRILVFASGLEAGEAVSLRMDDQEVASGTADAGGNVALRASLWRLIQISGRYTLFLYEAGESGFVLIGQQSFKVNLTLQISAQIDAKIHRLRSLRFDGRLTG